MVSPLNVLAFSDRRPGHVKQTQAIIEALEARTSVAYYLHCLVQTAGIPRLLHGLRTLLVPGRSFTESLPQKVDLIIGTGTGTHLPMIALKRRCRARLVTCMSPDPLLRCWFDLCFVPRHDNPPARKNIFPTFGPPCLKISGDDHDSHRGLILAGGLDPKSHYWDTSVFISQIRELEARLTGILWTISSSPRTPADTIEQLRRLAQESRNVTFFSADETPQGWIESAYRQHGQVWVTADSVSMVYEALTAGCRVGILPVSWKRQENKFQQGIDDLAANGLILDYKQWLGGKRWPKSLKPLDEAGRCASEILKRWWPERLA